MPPLYHTGRSMVFASIPLSERSEAIGEGGKSRKGAAKGKGKRGGKSKDCDDLKAKACPSGYLEDEAIDTTARERGGAKSGGAA